MTALAYELVARARAQGVMVALAESCTGGLVAGAITDVPGSSAVLERGFVTYTNEAKTEILRVDPALIDAHGAVSEEVAAAMADGALAASRADLALSITGIAGPGGSDVKPEGRVCFGCAGRGMTETERVDFGALGRSAVRGASVDHALRMALRRLGD